MLRFAILLLLLIVPLPRILRYCTTPTSTITLSPFPGSGTHCYSGERTRGGTVTFKAFAYLSGAARTAVRAGSDNQHPVAPKPLWEYTVRRVDVRVLQ